MLYTKRVLRVSKSNELQLKSFACHEGAETPSVDQFTPSPRFVKKAEEGWVPNRPRPDYSQLTSLFNNANCLQPMAVCHMASLTSH